MKRNKLLKKHVAILLMGLSLCMTGCEKQATVEESVPSLIDPVGVAIQTITVTREDIVKSTYDVCKVEPYKVELYFEIDGKVSEVCVNRGDFVKAGTVIAKLSEEDLMEELEKMEENIKETKESYEDQIESYEERLSNIQKSIRELKGKISSAPNNDAKNRYKTERELKNIELERVTLEYNKMKESMDEKLEKLNEEYDEKKELVGKNLCVATEDGVVTSNLDMLVGTTVKAEQKVVTLVDETKLYVRGNYISESNFEKLVDCYALINGQKISVSYVPLTDEELKRVTQTATPGKTVDRTIRYGLVPTKDQSISAGDYAIKVIVTLRKENVVVLPQGVVQKDKLGSYVYLLKDGVRSRVEVILGESDNCYVEVLGGLQEGDVVYVQY